MSGINLTSGNDSFLGTGSIADSVLGLGGDDTINGAAGADTIFGGSGNDSLIGGTVGDSLNGGEGDDTILPGQSTLDLSNDRVDGDDGNDWVSYANVSAPASATINLLTGSVSGYASDTLTSVENAIGSAANDSIIGTGAGNWLIGGNGNDTLAGGEGNDTLIGDNGADSLVGGSETDDWASYVGATSGVSVILAVPVPVASGGAGADSLSGIEGLIGSNFADTLLGNNGSNTLTGGGGSDSLFGGGGNDLLDYGAGDDVFEWGSDFAPGNLTLIGGDGGNDYLNLGANWVAVQDGAFTRWTQDGEADTLYSLGWETILCFAQGTRIVTPNGEDSVENLRAGDMVLAMRDGQAGFEPLRWVGFMDVAVPRNAAMAAKTAPVLIKAGALAAGMPARDLRVSPDHAMEIDGNLIPAKHLVNGVSIIQESWCRRVRYFHLELEAHGLLLSEGTWSESYLDDGNRHAFNNSAITGLFLDFEAGRSKGQYDHQACLPVLRQGLRLDEIHGRILRRAERLARGEKPRRLA